MVCWKEEAERKESVLSDALVMPSRHFDEAGRALALGEQALVDVPQLEEVHQVAGQVFGVDRGGSSAPSTSSCG